MADMQGRWFLIGWTALTTLGLGVGIVAGLLLGGPIEAVVGMMLVTPIVTSLVGAAVGCSQWPVMRSVLARPSLWVAASCMGLGAGLALGVAAVEQGGRLLTGGPVNVARLGTFERALSFAAVGAVSGLALGLAQALVFRWQGVRVRGWVAITLVALGLGFPLSSLAVDFLLGGVATPRGVVAFVLLAGLLFGAVTAQPLRRLAR
jgi:hypothetical protein